MNTKIDLIEIIYSAMNTHELPAIFTTPSKARKNSKHIKRSLKEIFDNTKKKVIEIYNKYSIQFNYRTADNSDGSQKNFLFQDYQYHSVINGNKNYIFTITDKSEKLNTIDFSAEKPVNENHHNIQSIISSVRGFIS